MSPKYPSQHSSHSSPSLARRAMPVMALGSLAGVLVFALDRPANSADASGDGSTDAVAEDTGSTDTVFDTGSTDQSAIDTTVPDRPERVADEEQAADTTEASPDTESSPDTEAAQVDQQQSSQQASEQTTATTVKKTTTSTKTTAAATKTSSSSGSCKAYKGPTVSTRWGPVQVKASVSSSGKICSVSVLQHPTGRKSDNINARAIPTLNSRAMSAQSASFSSVSGATVTSRAYKQSLQAIIDKAKA